MKLVIASLLLVTTLRASASEFFVAPSGHDTNPGTADKPFATLERARDAARKLRIQEPDCRIRQSPCEGMGAKRQSRIQNVVLLTAGTHRLTNTLELNEQDSDTTFRAVPGADVRLSGSVAIPNSAVTPVTDNATLDRLVPEVRGKVREIDLKKLGITDFGEIGPRGFRRPYIPAPLEMFVDDAPLSLAQWPNPGQQGEPVGKVIDKGSVTRNGQKPERGGTFGFKTDGPARWTQARDIWITGLFQNGYADNTVKVKSFDLAKKTLTTVHPHMYGFSSGKGWNRWTALNLLEEIDLPGEFAADKASGKLYYLPPTNNVGGAVPCRGRSISEPAKDNRRTECASHIERILEVSILKEPMVAIEGATNVVFDGITFENSRGMGIYIERGANNRIQNSILRNLGMVAVCIGKGISPDPDYRHAFTGEPVSRELGSWHEHIYDNPTFNRDAGTGQGIVNCHIYNIGEGAVSLGGGDRKTLTPAGNFVENCDIHNFNRWDRTYRGAVNIDGVGNRITHCKIHECPGSAIYLHGNDHVMEYNEIFHAMMSGDDMGAFYMGRDPTERGNIIRYNYWHDLATSHSTAAIYFDDSGGDSTKVYGNVFRNAGAGLGTVFLAGGSDFVVTNNLFIDCRRPLYAQGYRGGQLGIFKKRMAAVVYDSPVWKTRYPEFQNYLASGKPHSNQFKPNLIVKGTDPRFVDATNGNYALKPGAATGIPGFQPIPFDKIGLRKTNNQGKQ